MGSKYAKEPPKLGHGGPRGIDYRRSKIKPQAQSLISKFGGPRELARTFKACSDDPNDHYSPSTIYRWLYPRENGGTGGEIPLPALKLILRCARLAGVMLTTAEIYPHLVEPKAE